MPGSGKQKQADEEVSKILRENKQLKSEIDFLKKQRYILQKTTNKIHTFLILFVRFLLIREISSSVSFCIQIWIY